MNKKYEMIANLKAAGRTNQQIADRMGEEVEYIDKLLRSKEMRQAVRDAHGTDDGTQLYSTDEIKFKVEAMYSPALDVVEKLLMAPGSVTTAQWSAAQWVLQTAAAIQEMTKAKGDGRITNQFIIDARAGSAIEKLLEEMDKEDWAEKLEESISEMPEGIQ